jgi:hypothetical protein
MTLRKLSERYPSVFPDEGPFEEMGPLNGALGQLASVDERLAESRDAGFLLREEALRAAESEIRPTALGALGEAEAGRFPLARVDRYASRPVTRVVSAEGYPGRGIPSFSSPSFSSSSSSSVPRFSVPGVYASETGDLVSPSLRIPTQGSRFALGAGETSHAGMTYVVEYDAPAPGLVRITTDYVEPGGTLSVVLSDLSRKAGYRVIEGAPAVVRLQDLGDALRALNIEGYVPV